MVSVQPASAIYPSHSLRSTDQSLLMVLKTKKKHRGDRAFSVAASKLWKDFCTLGRPPHLLFSLPLLKHISLCCLTVLLFFFTLAFVLMGVYSTLNNCVVLKCFINIGLEWYNALKGNRRHGPIRSV